MKNLLFLGAGKAKDPQQDKGKGKSKGKGKGGGKGMGGQDSGGMLPLWFGDAAGDVICLVATPAQAAAHEPQLVPGVALKLTHVDVHER